MTFNLGLTGSIGMGKSTTANLFAVAGCAVWDADAAVHRLYDRDGAAVSALQAQFPDAIRDGRVDRQALKGILSKNPKALTVIESIVHPLVAQDREDFRRNTEADILVFDVPLLFETGGDSEMDAVACVTIDAKTQQKRVLERGTMTLDQFLLIRQKQMPIKEKTERSDYVIVTDTLDHARQQVDAILVDVREKIANA